MSLALAAIAWPTLSATITLVWVNQNRFAYSHAGSEYLAWFAGSFAVGALVGAALGPTLARWIVRLVVPPAARQALSHLWGSHTEV